MRDDFLELLKRLNDASVNYVVIGGFASVLYGSAVVTEDMDIACDFNPENIMRLNKAISDLKPVHRMTSKKTPLKLTKADCKDLRNLYLDTDLGQLDCIGSVEGLGDFENVKAASHDINIQGVSFSILNIEALIRTKKALGRGKDRLVVLQLEALKDLSNQNNFGKEK